ncbi:MAG TPA: DUF5996 family protein [Candidatus Dormibacteraeota bacterium]
MREPWPALPYEDWRDTCDTLHLWMQIVGKVKLALSPFQNEYWHAAFHLTARGLTTGVMPYRGRSLEVQFDFVDHNVFLHASDGQTKALALTARPVADFYADFFDVLAALAIEVSIDPRPSEMPNAISCDIDRAHASYDAEYARRWWEILLRTQTVMERFRSSFVGKSSPIHFFWGSFDLAYSRYSGRPAPLMRGVPRFMQIAEDQENFSCGFWPGNATASGIEFGRPAFYAYSYPEPDGFKTATFAPEGAYYDHKLGEVILPYDVVLASEDPDEALLKFFRRSYEVAATLGNWDRAALEVRKPEVARR